MPTSKKICTVIGYFFAISYIIAFLLVFPFLVLMLGFSLDSPYANHSLNLSIFCSIIGFLIYEGIFISIAIFKKFKLIFSLLAFIPLIIAAIFVILLFLNLKINENNRKNQVLINKRLLESIETNNVSKAAFLVGQKAQLPISFRDLDLNKLDIKTQIFIINNCSDKYGYCYLSSFMRSFYHTRNNPTENNKKIAQLKKLLKEGANPNFTGSLGYLPIVVPLFESVSNKNIRLELIKIFLRYGADINKKGILGLTSLMKASDYGDVNLVKYLLNHGANINLVNNEGNNALWYAVSGSISTGCINCLLDRGVNIKHKNKLGESIIFAVKEFNDSRFDYASKRINKTNIFQLFDLLNKQGINFYAKNKAGYTVFDKKYWWSLKYSYNYKKIYKLLIEYQTKLKSNGRST